MVELTEEFSTPEALKQLAGRVNKLRKPAPVSRIHDQNLAADIPILAKL